MDEVCNATEGQAKQS